MTVRYVLVTLCDKLTRVPNVLEDYIYSLNMISDVIHVNEFSYNLINTTNNVYIFTQMWLEANNIPPEIARSGRMIYLNVEMLSEITRINHVIALIQSGVRIADYSLSNLTFLKLYTEDKKIMSYKNDAVYLPYQYNLRDQVQLENIDGLYTYDIGIINALPKKDASVNSSLTYRRTLLWEQLEQTGLKCINILGWGAARDEILKRCKVIINVHHFECFNIFEQIRCDRLLFAKKIIISDKSIYTDNYDMLGSVIWEDYDNIIPRTKEVLENFEIYNNKMKSLNMDNVIANRRKQLSDASNQMQ